MTADKIKEQFRQRGETITEWAAKHGYTRNSVYRVLNGQDKGYWGRGHEIAVKLGMKSAAEQLAA